MALPNLVAKYGLTSPDAPTSSSGLPDLVTTKYNNFLPTANTPAPASSSNGISGLFSTAYNAVKNYVTSSASQAVDFEKQVVTNPLQTEENVASGFGNGIIDAVSSSFKGGTDAVSSMLDDYKNGTGSTAGDVANLAKLASSVAGVLFSPVSGTFAGAAKVPVLKQVADAINIPFTLTGLAASYGTGKIFDIIPDSVLSKKSKDILREPISNLVSLAAQVTIGGKIFDKLSSTIKDKGSVTTQDAERIASEAIAENPGVVNPAESQAPETPHTKQSHEDYARSQGYEPYTPPDELPSFDVGPAAEKTAETLPTIDAGEGEAPAAAADDKNDLKIVPIGDEPAPVVPEPKAPAARAKSGEAFVKPKVLPDTGNTETSGLAKKINTEAIEAGLNDNLGKLPVYSRMSMKEQAQLAGDLIAKDPEKALKVATLQEASPHSGLLPESVSTAFRVMIDNGDITGDFAERVVHTLGTSKSLAGYAARLGQGIKALDTGLDTYQDPIRIISDIAETREKNVEGKNKGIVEKEAKKTVKEIKTELKKSVSKKKTWDDFIKEIQCQY